ncbi:hypothetical protein AMR74_16510 [Halorubrum tropicale]|uniref:Uncharacterized protein n=1 Tax=Halorubrum tropicale TaxID=1765655 RepID=A0A0M9ALH9_9EURY|nr:hypothetical protein AMR74_16510 [Halorubrum tropicale]
MELEERGAVGTTGLAAAAVGDVEDGALRRVRYRMDKHLISGGLAYEVDSKGDERIFELTPLGKQFLDEHRDAVESVGVVRELAADAETAAEQAERAAERVDGMLSRIQSVEGTAGAASREISNLKDEIGELQETVRDVKSNVSSVEYKVKSIKSDSKSARSMSLDAVKRSEEVEEEMDELRSEISEARDELTERIADLEERHQKFTEETVKRVRDEQEFADDLELRIAVLEGRVDDVEAATEASLKLPWRS